MISWFIALLLWDFFVSEVSRGRGKRQIIRRYPCSGAKGRLIIFKKIKIIAHDGILLDRLLRLL